MKTIHSATDLAALLVRRREAVVSAWSSLLRELPGGHYRLRSAEELAAWTTQGVEAIIESLDTDSSEPLEAHAARVSRVRTRLGFEIHEVVQGLLLLGEAAQPEIVDAYLDHPGRAREATQRLNRCLRTMLASFAAHFTDLMHHSVRSEQERTHLLMEVAEAAGSSLDLDLVLPIVADSVKRALGGSYCTIYLWDEPKEALSPKASTGHIENQELAKAMAGLLTPEADPLIARALSTRNPVTHPSSEQDPPLPGDLCAVGGVAGAVALPILVAHRILALALVLVETPFGGPEQEQVALASAIANATAPAVDNARRYAEASEQLIETRRMEQVTTSFLDAHGLQEVLALICREIRGLSGAPRASVYLADTSGELRCAFSSGTEVTDAPAAARLTLPLSVKNHDLGQVLLDDLPRDLEADEAGFLERFAHHAAAAIEHASYHEQKEKLAALEERQTLAHELHDSVTQSLYGVTMYAEAAARQQEAGDLSKAAQLLQQIGNTSMEALREMRLLLFDLRPSLLAERGLVAALQARLSSVEGRARVQTQLTAEGVESLPHQLAEGLYGICTEALNNSLKHARASRISVGLREVGSKVRLEIEDDGQGFDPAGVRGKGGMGLVGMEERAARLGAHLSVTSRVGEGTRIRVDAPLKAPPGQQTGLEGEA